MNSKELFGYLRGLGGAIVGGIVGYFLFRWIAGQGFYALAVPGALLGLGWALASMQRSLVGAIVCAIAALPLGLYAEWSFAPFLADPSLSFFLSHVHQLRPLTWIMIAVGVVAAGIFGAGWGRWSAS